MQSQLDLENKRKIPIPMEGRASVDAGHAALMAEVRRDDEAPDGHVPEVFPREGLISSYRRGGHRFRLLPQEIQSLAQTFVVNDLT